MGVRIITDSGSDLSAVETKDITVMPLKVTFGQEDYLDGVTLSHKRFYEKLIESDEIPKTSQVSPYEFEAVFQETADAGDTAVVITLSKKISGTWQSAMIAARGFENRVFVVDSESVSLGQYILVRYAVWLRDAGRSAAEIVEMIEEKRQSVCVIALLETLEYLKKGGRIGKAAAFAGGLLSIRPVVSLADGEVVVLGKARGSKKGNNMLVEIIKKKNGINFDMPMMLGYTGLSDAVLQKYISDSETLWSGNIDELPVTSIGGTIGTYAGPGAVVVAFFHK